MIYVMVSRNISKWHSEERVSCAFKFQPLVSFIPLPPFRVGATVLLIRGWCSVDFICSGLGWTVLGSSEILFFLELSCTCSVVLLHWAGQLDEGLSDSSSGDRPFNAGASSGFNNKIVNNL